jgi:tetratricopeptide (TPR) repeat protein
VAEFETALRLAPDLAEAHYNLGRLLLTMPDRRGEALAHFEAALRIRPDLEPARQMLNRLRAAGRPE